MYLFYSDLLLGKYEKNAFTKTKNMRKMRKYFFFTEMTRISLGRTLIPKHISGKSLV